MLIRRACFVVAATVVTLAFSSCASIDARRSISRGDAADIRSQLEHWRQDFNAGRKSKVCALFAPDLVAEIQGAPDRNFSTHCRGMKRVLSDPVRSFSYAVKIHEIIVSGDYSVVRLRWTLTVTDRPTGKAKTSVEEGMDIFRRDPEGWRICRFVVFDR